MCLLGRIKYDFIYMLVKTHVFFHYLYIIELLYNFSVNRAPLGPFLGGALIHHCFLV